MWTRGPQTGSVSPGQAQHWVPGDPTLACLLARPLRQKRLSRGPMVGGRHTHGVEELRGQAQVVVQSQKGDPLQPHHDDLQREEPAERDGPPQGLSLPTSRAGEPLVETTQPARKVWARGRRNLHCFCKFLKLLQIKTFNNNKSSFGTW